VIVDAALGLPAAPEVVDPPDCTRRRVIPEGTPYEDLLVPVLRGGEPVWTPPPLAGSRARAAAQLGQLHSGAKRLVHPHAYPVGLERSLHDLRTRLVLEARARVPRRSP
jgi:nicotinate phosphoribosyltransferase